MAGSQGLPPFEEAECLHSAGRLGQARGTWGQHLLLVPRPAQLAHSWQLKEEQRQ